MIKIGKLFRNHLETFEDRILKQLIMEKRLVIKVH